MSRSIQNDHPWDDSEIQYMLDRGRQKEVAKNKKDFPPGSKPKPKPVAPQDDSVELELSPEVYDFVNGLEVNDLQSELKKRDLSVKGDEIDMKVRLAQYMQRERDEHSDA